MAGADPYRYFRIEAQELLEGLSQGLLELGRGEVPAELAPQLLRLAHTLKGASRVVQLPELGALAHRFEDHLAPHRAQAEPLSRAELTPLQELIDQIARQLAPVFGPAARAAAAPAPAATAAATAPVAGASPAAERSLEQLRVQIADLDALLEHVCELESCASVLRESPQGSARARGDALGALERELESLRQRIEQMRLVPAQVLFAELERALLETAARGEKQVRFEASGGEISLDAQVLRVLRPALVQVVCNSAAHGIEPPAQRRARGKPAVGRVALRVEQYGQRIRLHCEDDGAGIDEAGVRRALLRQSRLSEEQIEALDSEQLAEELLRGGLTTCAVPTALAGRGVGLDVLRDALEQLKGRAALHSRPQQGTALELWVPSSLSSLPALRLEAGGASALLPLDAVLEVQRLGDAELALSPGGAETLAFGGQLLPFAPLAELLPGAERNAPPRIAVIVQARGRCAALGVSALGEVQRCVVRKLPALAREHPLVAGAALDRRGQPQLVLSPAALLDAAVVREAPLAGPAAPRRAPVLVIDDSLTTRMLEQSILEAAGYEVELAVSALEALRLAAQRVYSVFVVDVEMPGMDGFEFVSRTRADPRLREIPSIIVSSRADANHRRRGRDAGARAYIDKGEFDQGVLLDAIRRLVG